MAELVPRAQGPGFFVQAWPLYRADVNGEARLLTSGVMALVCRAAQDAALSAMVLRKTDLALVRFDVAAPSSLPDS